MESGPALILRTLDRHLTGPGRIRLFGGAALVLAYGRSRQTEDADLLLDDGECQALIDRSGFAEAVEATNTELNPRGLYLTHIFGPEQQILAPGWMDRCRRVALPDLTKLEVSVLAPVDLALTKLGRGDEGDFEDIRFLVDSGHVEPRELLSALAEAAVPDILREQFERSSPKLLALCSEAGSGP